MAKIHLDKSYFSLHFLILTFMGGWIPTDITHHSLYAAFKTIMTAIAFGASSFVFVDLYIVFGDLKRMSWNLCVNVLFFGGLLKNIYSFHKKNVINKMRIKLHGNATARDTPDDQVINELGEKEMKYIRLLFYGTAIVFIPLWLLSWYFSYLWGPRGIPLPMYIPFEWNPDDELQYNIMFFGLAFGGCAGIIFVMETELAMFSLLIQISREYNRLLMNLTKINELYEEDSPGIKEKSKLEVNPLLRKTKIKTLLKEYSRDQQQLIQYTKDFELSYSYTMLLQVVFLSILILFLAMLCILEYDNISLNISYQVGYISIVSVDMFLVCWYTSRIHGQCLRVGEEAYSILWYQMGPDIQRDLCMMIMRSQHPPKITSGKLMEMNLHAFMLVMRTIYSWLTLFRRIAFK